MCNDGWLPSAEFRTSAWTRLTPTATGKTHEFDVQAFRLDDTCGAPVIVIDSELDFDELESVQWRDANEMVRLSGRGLQIMEQFSGYAKHGVRRIPYPCVGDWTRAIDIVLTMRHYLNIEPIVSQITNLPAALTHLVLGFLPALQKDVRVLMNGVRLISRIGSASFSMGHDSPRGTAFGETFSSLPAGTSSFCLRLEEEQVHKVLFQATWEPLPPWRRVNKNLFVYDVPSNTWQGSVQVALATPLLHACEVRVLWQFETQGGEGIKKCSWAM